MHKAILACCASFLLCANVTAAEKPRIEVRGDGMRFPVIVNVDDGGKNTVEKTYYGSREPLVIEVEVGTHTVEVRHYRVGFPQLVYYRLYEGDKLLWYSETFTVDPKAFTIKPGQVLSVIVERPLEPYNGKFFDLKFPKTELKEEETIRCAILMTRPYWFQDVDRPWKAKEKYPNALFFLVDPEWGPEKVFSDLAKSVVEGLHKADLNPVGDYRGNAHWTCLVNPTSTGKVPETLINMNRKDLEELLKKEFLKAYESMVREKTYRTWDPGQTGELKKAGYLPKETPEGRVHTTFAQGIELAKPQLEAWLKKQK